MKNVSFVVFFSLVSMWQAAAQDTNTYRLRMSFPLLDLPQNSDLPYSYPSMGQSLALANDFYDLSYWGIDALGNAIIKTNAQSSGFRKVSNGALTYALGLAFARYGSELPIPLGVWTHEEFHRSVLGVSGVSSENGNWFLSRWDGTVYGVSDQDLTNLKANDLNQLLYSYVAGVQSEVMINRNVTLDDFYHQRAFYKNSLLLYNAWYVHNYFSFSTSFASDSVKVIAPEHEDANPSQRDFAGADLTAWAYDMFNPNLPYDSRDDFPNGEGENRRVGFSDLSKQAQDFLNRQKDLSLLNFINPAILFVNRIKLGDQLSFTAFAQYAPTHFGNDVSFYLPVQYRKFDVLLAMHNYNASSLNTKGFELGLYNFSLGGKAHLKAAVNVWKQPETFFGNNTVFGGNTELGLNYRVTKNFSGFLNLSGKTKGFQMGNPYLKSVFSMQLGVQYNLI